MSYAVNGIVNVSGGDYDASGGNTFDDPDAQYGAITVGSANTTTLVSANSSIVGNDNTLSASVNAGILGRGNEIYDSNYTWIVGGDGKIVNTEPNKTFVPNHYVVLDSGNVVTSTGAAAAAPRYLQVPGVVAVPTGANDEFTFAIPNGGLAFDSAGERPYVKITAGWSKLALNSDLATAQTLAQTLSTGNTTGASDIYITATREIKYNDGIRIGGDGVNAGGVGIGGISIGNNAEGAADDSTAVGKNANIAGAATGATAVGATALITAPGVNGTAVGY